MFNVCRAACTLLCVGVPLRESRGQELFLSLLLKAPTQGKVSDFYRYTFVLPTCTIAQPSHSA